MREHPQRRTFQSDQVPAPIAYSELTLDMDKFEGKPDAEIVAHLKNVAFRASEGQLRLALGIEPTDPYLPDLDTLAKMYVKKTIETVRRLRGEIA